MDQHQVKFWAQQAEHLIKRLKKRRFEADYVATAAEAKDFVLSLLPQGASVFRCGSMTLAELGLWSELAASPDHELIDPYQPQLSPEEGMALRVKGMSADVMLASSNAITLDGRLVNLDGMGNRIAAMAFGPAKVILVVGMNKIAPDLESAMARVKHHAAPINSIRLNLPTPCVETGLCADCNSPKRICNMWSIIDRQMIEGRIHVVLVGQDLGY